VSLFQCLFLNLHLDQTELEMLATFINFMFSKVKVCMTIRNPIVLDKVILLSIILVIKFEYCCSLKVVKMKSCHVNFFILSTGLLMLICYMIRRG